MSEEQEQQEEITQPLHSEVAFLCYKDSNGHWMATPDLKKPVVVARVANFDDYIQAGAVIAIDVATQLTAAKTVQLQSVAAAQMAERMAAARIADTAGVGGAGGAVDLSRIGS